MDGSGAEAAGVDAGAGDSDVIATTATGAINSGATSVVGDAAGGSWLVIACSACAAGAECFAGWPARDCSMDETKRK